jgi:hypothetical protein
MESEIQQENTNTNDNNVNKEIVSDLCGIDKDEGLRIDKRNMVEVD